MAYQSRSAWTNRPNRAVKTRFRQQHLTWHYPGFGTDSVKTASWSHDRCLRQIDTWERQHQARGSKNIEYNWFACPHGYLIEGRGNRQNGANGTSHANRRGQSCQVLIGDNEPLTAGHRSAMRECVAKVEGYHKGSTSTQYGHRHWVGTRCPGPHVMAEIPVRAGASIPIGGGAGVPQPSVKPDPARPWLTSPRVAGMSTTEVREVQGVLVGLGYDLGKYGIDGSYGDATGTAVKALQQQLGVTSDGIYGLGTEKALMTTLDKISKQLDHITRALEPGIAGKRTDGEFAAFVRDARNMVRDDVKAIPAQVLDEPVALKGDWEGKSGTLRGMRAWYAEDLRQIKTALAKSRTAVLEAVQETGRAQGLTDEQVQAIATAAAEAAARVNAEDVAAHLEVGVKEG